MMTVTLWTQGLQCLEQMGTFLEGSEPIGFASPQRSGVYEFIAHNLRRFGYARLGREDRGLGVCTA